MEALEKHIIEGNRLIAEFIGWEVSNKGRKFKNHLPPYGYAKVHPDYLKFHQSWDWIMEAVYKIVNELDEHNRTKKHEHVLQALMTVEINEVFGSVVEYIKWYNVEE